jgi:hypothetical protein
MMTLILAAIGGLGAGNGLCRTGSTPEQRLADQFSDPAFDIGGSGTAG